MANCLYYYNDKGWTSSQDGVSLSNLPSAKTVDGLLTKVLSENPNQELFEENPDLIYYDASVSPKEEMKIKIQHAAQESLNKPGTAVTTIINNLFSKRFTSASEYISSGTTDADWASNFQKEFGTLIHKCIENYHTPNFDKACDNLHNFIKEKHTELQTKVNFNPDKDIRFKKACANVLNNLYDKADNDWIIDFVENIWKQCKFSTNKPMFEVPVYYEANNGEKIVGRLDAVTIDENGVVHIYDFKTSASTRSSDNINGIHFAQLYMYQNMLAAYGIPAKKIEIHNAHLNYADGNITVKSMTIFNPNSSRNAVSIQKQVRAALKPYFPQTNANITTEEKRTIGNKISEMRKNIFTEKALNKEEEENFTEYISNLDSTRVLRSDYLRDRFTIKIEGNNIVLTSVTTGEVVTEDLSSFVKNELQVRKNNQAEELELFKEAVRSGNTQKLGELMSQFNGRNINVVNYLGEYTAPNWEVIDDPVFDEQGIIVLYNNANNTYDFVSLVSNVNFDYVYHMHANEKVSMNILGNLFDSRELSKYRDANMQAKISDIRILQTLMAVSLGQKVLKKREGEFNVGQIRVLSSVTGFGSFTTDYTPYMQQMEIINAIAQEHPDKLPNREIYEEAVQGMREIKWLPQVDILIQQFQGLFFTSPDIANTVSSVWSENFERAINAPTLTDKIERLEKLLQDFRTEFADKLNIRDKYQRDYSSDISKMERTLSNVIAAYRGFWTDQAYPTSGMSIDYNNSLRTAYQLIKNGDVGKYSANGVLITGILQGLSTATPYANPDDSVRRLSTLHTFGTTQVQMQAEPFIESQNKATSEWLASKKSLGEILLVGNHHDLYKQLFEKDKDGNVDKAFRFKNPFTDMSLTEADKQYLKITLWNKMRISGTTQFTDSVKALDFHELSTNAAYKTDYKKFQTLLKADPNYLNVPLRTASEARLIASMSKLLVKGDWKAVKQIWQRKLEKSRTWWDPTGLSDKQLNEKEEKMKTLQAYNIYNESLTARRSRLADNDVESFEWNVNYLINDYIYSYISVNVNQKLLNSTDQIVAILRTIEDYTGRDLSAQVTEIYKRNKISIYNSNTVDLDYKDLTNFVGHLRSMVNFGKIALRPALMAKELTVGRVKNYLYASMGYFEDITLKDMLKGEAIVFGEGVFKDKWDRTTGKMKPNDRSKVEALNWLYRIANMDANILSQKTIADRFGFMNQGGDIAYYTSTRPDWYNRLSIFVAKMIADGCWEAHCLDKNNHLVYDMSKDKRYAVYAKYRDKAPDSKSSDFSEYQKQKARYNWAFDSLVKAGLTHPDGTPLQHGEDLPIAYTVEETNSVKELVGMIYGYYNHEEKTSFQTGSYANLFMAFKTYIVGELKHYFALPGGKTSIGKLAQMRDGIATKDNPEGSLLYEKEDEKSGLVTYVTNRYNEDGSENKPYLKWTAYPPEGIFTSCLICFGDIFTKQGREDLRKNKKRRKNAEIFLLRALFASLFGSIIALIFSGSEKDAKSTQMALNIASKVGSDLSFYHSVIEPVDDMGIVGMDYLTNLATSTMNVLTDGNKDIQSLIYKNLQAANDFKLQE